MIVEAVPLTRSFASTIRRQNASSRFRSRSGSGTVMSLGRTSNPFRASQMAVATPRFPFEAAASRLNVTSFGPRFLSKTDP